MASGLLIRAGVSKHTLAVCHLLAKRCQIRSPLLAFCLVFKEVSDTDDGSILLVFDVSQLATHTLTVCRVQAPPS